MRNEDRKIRFDKTHLFAFLDVAHCRRGWKALKNVCAEPSMIVRVMFDDICSKLSLAGKFLSSFKPMFVSKSDKELIGLGDAQEQIGNVAGNEPKMIKNVPKCPSPDCCH